MDSLPSSKIRSLIGPGLETLPWAGLAVGSTFLPAAALQPLPSPHLLLPVLILATGGLSIVGRRMWNSTYTPPSQPSSSPAPSTQTAPSPSSHQGDGAPSAPTADLIEATISKASSEDPEASGNSSVIPPSLSSQQQSKEELPCRETQRDGLTGLATRSCLLSEVSALLEQSGDNGSPALLSITIDEYRDVTGSFGHDAGRQLLISMASRIEDIIPPTALAARIAEDTFAVLLKQSDTEETGAVGHELLNEFDQPFQIAGHEVPIQASVGASIRPAPDTTFSSAEEMLQASYSAMHHVQRQGGGTINVYQSGDREQTRWLHRRERLREAIHQDELTLHYQPIVHLVSEEIVGAEALIRWEHPERGLLPPSAFIPLAEETELVGDIDRWVFEQTLQNASTWTRSSGNTLEWISMNISPQSVEPDLQDWCREKLSGSALPEAALHLEITERWALRDERSLRPLRNEGISLSIDDFGTGYSSLRYLRSLEADILKIDREFIQDLGRDPKTTAIVQFLMNLSLRLDVEVIAEGVETKEQEDTLRELGCAMAQGYHFSKPLPAETLLQRAGSKPEPSERPSEDLLRSSA